MIDLIATDTMFPEYRYGMDTDEYLRENNNYLFLLREDLNYALHNLGIANFNARQLETLSGRISEPLYSRIEDAEGNIASLSYDYGLIEARVSDNEQSISDIRIDAQGIHTQVSEIQGDISDISGDVSGLTTRVSSVEQTASGISATVQEIQGDVSDLSDDLTSTTARVAQVEITAGSISSTVQELSTTVSGLDGSVTSLTSRVSSVEQTATSISSTVQEISGDYISATSAKQTSGSFSLTVKNGSGSNAAVLDKNGLSVYGGALSLYSAGTASSNRVLYADNSGNLYIKGQITATSLSLGNGVTIDAAKLSGYIDGARIQSGTITGSMISAGTITANNIAANTITAAKIATGTITANEIAAGTITAAEIKAGTITAAKIQTGVIPTKVSSLTNDSGYQTSSGVTTIADNRISTGYITAQNLSVYAANILGTLSANHIKLGGNMAVYQNLTDTSSVGGYVGYTTSNIDGSYGIAISAPSGGQCVATNNGARISYGNAQVYCSTGTGVGFAALGAISSGYTVRFTGSTGGMYFAPVQSCSANVGCYPNSYGVQPFNDGYFYNELSPVSDRNLKHDINYDISAYDDLFDELKPASFKLNNGTSGRTHLGFIAQDVEQSVYDTGLTTTDFASLVIAEYETADGVPMKTYFLRKGEMIAMLVRQIQLLKARVTALEV